jgi:hypothetical protein
MAEGFLGGLGGFGDFLTGGGIYSDPKAINQTYGVPEGDVRQAAINQLSQLSALALAAGQPMEGSQRAQLLAQMGQTGGQFNTNLYNAAQRRLMTGQIQERQDELARTQAMAQKVKDDPEGLAASLRLPVDLVKTIPTKSLIDLATQVQIKRATVEPTQAYLTAAQGAGAPAPTGGAPAPVASAPTFAAPDPFLQSLEPNARALVQQYSTAINAANQQGNAKAATDLSEALFKQVPGLKEAQVETAKAKAAEIVGAPKAYDSASETIKIIDSLIAHPGRESATGASAVMRYLPASEARAYAAKEAQLKGRAFLQGYASILGGGAISEKEGAKAEQAIAAIGDPFIPEKEYLQALKDFREVTLSLAEKAKSKMGGKLPEGSMAIPQMPTAGSAAPTPQQRQTAPQGSITGRARIISVE